MSPGREEAEQGGVSWRALAGIGGTVLCLLGAAWARSIEETATTTSETTRRLGERVASIEAKQIGTEQRLVRIEAKLDELLARPR